MKKNHWFQIALTLLLFISFIVESRTVSAQKSTILTVVLKGSKEAKAFLQKDMETISAPNKDGVFTFEIPLSQESFYDFGCGNNASEIYIEPGDHLVLTANENDFNTTLIYTGNRSTENNYLHVRNSKRRVFGQALTGIRSYLEKDFLVSLDSVIAIMKDDFDQYNSSNPGISQKFKKHEHINFSFIRVNQKSVFANNYDKNHTDRSTLSSGFSDYLKTLAYNDASLLPSPRFRDFVRNIRYNETAKLLARKPQLADSSNDNIKAMFLVADSLFTDPAIKNYSLYTTLKFELRQFGLAIPADVINTFYARCTDEAYVNEIKENYYIWANLKKGNDAPVFAASGFDGKKISLTDLDGKYVYIDVWATWCAPCIQEMPAFETLVDKFKDNKEIVFVKVSIDVNKQAWENKISKDPKNSALNLWVENGAGSDFAKAYAIKDIPRYIIIDKNKKIINAQAAAPSQIENQLTAILKNGK